MAACIQISDLTKCFGSTVAVGGLTLEVESGEILGLLGPNGAGKSTILYMLAGLSNPTSGTISIFGKRMNRDFLEIASNMGVVFERPAFYNNLSARRNLLLVTKLAGRNVTVDRTLDMVGLLEYASKKVDVFSHGMRQRLALAQALLTEPRLLLLDEPTTGLDVESAFEIINLLRRLADEAKVTIVFSSHLLNEVEMLCDRVAVLNKGRLVACESTDALLSYDQTVVDILVDAPEAAAKRLSEEDWVDSVTVKSRKLIVRLKEPNVHRLNTFLVGTGYKLSGVMPHRRTLRDYFLKVLDS